MLELIAFLMLYLPADLAWLWSWLLSGMGMTGLYLAGRGIRHGLVVNMAAQVLWIAYALVTGQYGFLVSALGYGFVYVRLWQRTRRELQETELLKRRLAQVPPAQFNAAVEAVRQHMRTA